MSAPRTDPPEESKRPARAIALTDDGRLVATGDISGTIQLVRTNTGHRVTVLRGHQQHVNALAFTPDGCRLVSIGEDGQAIIWNLQSGGSVNLGLPDAVGCHDVAVGPDGHVVGIACSDGKVRLWDLDRSSPVASWVLDTGADQPLHSLDIGVGGSRFVAAGDGGAVYYWESLDADVLRLDGHTARVRSVTFSPTGDRIVSGGEDKAILVWDPEEKALEARLEDHDGWVRSIAVTSGRIYSGSDDRTVRVWDMSTGRSKVVKTYEEWVYSVAVNESSGVLVAVPGGHVWVYHPNGQQRQVHEAHDLWVTAAVIMPKSRTVVAGLDEGNLVIARKDHRPIRIDAHRSQVRSLAVSPDEALVASGCDDGDLVLWWATTGQVKARLPKMATGVQSIAFSPDGTMLAAGDQGGIFGVWYVEDGSLLLEKSAHTDWILGLSWVGDTELSTIGDTRMLRWSVPDGDCVDHWRPEGAEADLSTAALDGPGGTRAVGDRVGGVRLLSPEEHLIAPERQRWVRVLCWVLGTNLLAVGRGGVVHLIDSVHGTSTRLTTHDAPVLDIRVVDGRGLVIVFGDGAVEVQSLTAEHDPWAVAEADRWPATVAYRPRYMLVSNDEPSEVDLLGMDPDLQALAHIMVAESSQPPLAIALLGVWGSGKTTFIRHLRRTIETLTAAEWESHDPQFVRNVRFVDFNAWDYSDVTPLVGMGTEIFRDLRDQARDTDLPAITDPAKWRRKVDHARAAADWREAVADTTTSLPARALVWLRGPVPTRDGRPSLLLSWFRYAALVVAVPLTLTLAVLLAIKTAQGEASVANSELLPGGPGDFVFLLVCTALISAIVRAITLVKETNDSLRWAGSWMQTKSTKQWQHAQIALRELDPMARLSELIQAAKRSDQQSKHRGVVGDLYEQLRALGRAMTDAKSAYDLRAAVDEDPGEPPIERIFLLVDDLDRCEPDRVVDVLQAVHLLQATGLFVVLVAVDPRWLHTSLSKHRAEAYLDVSQSIHDRVGDPLDYLTKIFQIPFQLPHDGRDKYLVELAATVRAVGSAAELAAPAATGTGELGSARSRSGPSRASAGGGAADLRAGSSRRRAGVRRPDTAELLTVSKPVAEYLNDVARHFTTPRAAKRLINLYQVVRIHQRFATGMDIERDPESYHVVGLLLGLVTGAPSLAEMILSATATASDDDGILELVRSHRQRHTETHWRPGEQCGTCLVWQVVEMTVQVAVEQDGAPATAGPYASRVALVSRFGFHKELIWRMPIEETLDGG